MVIIWSGIMADNEATARIRINQLLERAGWRLLPVNGLPANVQFEAGVSLKQSDLDALGDDFEKVSKGFVDFLLLDERGRPLVVLEAKSSSKHPLVGKEQARTYARGLNCRFVLLSNGNMHYFWDLEQGNPQTIRAFPTPESVGHFEKRQVPDTRRLVNEDVGADYIAVTKMPDYDVRAGWINQSEREEFKRQNKLRFLRDYQVDAVKSIQRSVKDGNERFLFEMATGTGKTLTAAAIIKLFLRTGNASRVLFLVDRLELEDQAQKAFTEYLSPDFTSTIYKQDRDGWRRADIVVTTVQSLLANNKYADLFSPTDFDFVISDEAHRSISGNARAVFDYFVGYKLGLTATPRSYLRNIDVNDPTVRDPREMERRQLLDTYQTFGCGDGQPTFRYSLIDGANDGFLINPRVVDARTDVSTQLLSDQGFMVAFTDEEGEDATAVMKRKDFEKKFYSDATNRMFCKVFIDNALRDPINNEIGKSIIFAVSQDHAAKLTNILNEFAHRKFPHRYQSDFAVQVTSVVPNAQQYTVNFANNNLLGRSKAIDGYLTSKARVCVTVGMMTTGYDCPDILNLGLMRPIFSPTDFIQIKGRGTRTHDFREHAVEAYLKEGSPNAEKSEYKLIDFFGNCEYFENDFNYDEVLELPQIGETLEGPPDENGGPAKRINMFTYVGEDELYSLMEERIGFGGMKIDRMFFNRFADVARNDETLKQAVESEAWDEASDHVVEELFDKPEEYFNLEKLRRALNVDRRVTIREILEHVFGRVERLKTRDEMLEEEFGAFVARHAPNDAAKVPVIKAFFKAYATDGEVRNIIDSGNLPMLSTNPGFSFSDYRELPADYRKSVPEYIKDYVSLNQFA